MLSLESDEMMTLWKNDRKMFTFYANFWNSIQPILTTFVKKFSDFMLSLESDKMSALRPNNSLTSNISQYLTILDNVWWYWTIIVPYRLHLIIFKKFSDFVLSLESDEMTALWPNNSLTSNISQYLTILDIVW